MKYIHTDRDGAASQRWEGAAVARGRIEKSLPARYIDCDASANLR